MTEMTGSTFVLDALDAEGVTTLFGLIGEGNAHLIDATNDHDIAFQYARHEQVAVSMADGYARTTGGVGVCTLTHGPGVTNGATGIAAADRDNVPLVVLVGDTGFSGRETSLQYLDHVTFTDPISVYQTRAETLDTIGETLRRAFSKARTKRGPAIVELPGDIQENPVPDEAYNPRSSTAQRIHADPETVVAAADILDAAAHPVILAGGGARASDAADAITALAERLGAPIATTYFAKGLFDHDHPLHSGIAGTFMTPANDALLPDADAVLTVGAQLSGKSTRYGALYEDAAIVQIDTSSDALGRYRDPTVGVLGDARATVAALEDRIEANPERVERVKDTIADTGHVIPFEEQSNGPYVDPRALTLAVSDRTAGDAVVAVDSGNNTGFPAVFHELDAGGQMLVNGNFGTMGYALPAALGAQYADRDRDVVCYMGDGAFMQVVQDVETAVRLRLPVVFVVLNDESYGIIRHRQHLEFDRATAADYESPEFEQVARGLGAHAATIRSTDDLDVLDEFLDDKPDVPLVLDVRTNPDIARPGFPPY
ncbi:thiamine pyrophosphate-binding protein [Halorubrum sp. GN11_10-6_MGM]|uniref:thiamine pyrophosphate-binding protein n=1 Tax=Halorubrum sp. GN11_10-6_MGM TaxID=2518112 RepID=UPI0010FA16D7|nr:thiamine pyrophosphate-binding protein [Halorubrum sp. GN11_10-6_MGM]TKX73073.1 thiamine pyrophosphate-binding protein [Halorubrum sp. GN11_10-6_MGM]